MKENKTPRVKFSIKGKVTQIDKYYLDALALAHFGQKYEDKAIKKQVNKIVRDLMKDEIVSVQAIQQKILASFLPQSIQNQLNQT
ncbi:hypothetical protein E0765_04695 [Sulfuricurvum sp. IAE1]|uniref:hypothetical protein n=1 Tax=Sulfuricurvum sp. IAE1 TaxID=2546102 RepID=UPI0010438575|nr:hypothetical protein [Sulfuricurvum sp. IAE1]TDA65783.1 hypothetical protein E0765_04695 [Sulfuricurvum sp. IAE1]